MFFEEYINFKIFCYLWCCGVIPVQSFGSHICPKPPGLGLNEKISQNKLIHGKCLLNQCGVPLKKHCFMSVLCLRTGQVFKTSPNIV